jgi:RNA polymerase sigma-70 factor (ECF subfamily)
MPIEDMPEATNATPATQEDTIFGKEVLLAIERLPPDHRSIILLISVEDLSYVEAAQVLGIPLGTVMSRLSRAREQLRAILESPRVNATAGQPQLRIVK